MSRPMLLLAAALVLVATACGGRATGSPREVILVSAASSLTDSFAGIESAFESANPGVDVVVNLAGSSVVREQILEGAPADVFAPADSASMELVVAAGGAEAPQGFATNQLSIAVPAGNPGNVKALDDFADAGRLIGLCAAGVPCGDLARAALDKAGVTAATDTNEPNVRALLTKVEAGELDAAIVYVSDVAASQEVSGVEIPAAVNVTTTYPIAVTTGGPNPDGAARFVAFVLSADGQAILARHGFGTP